MSKNSTPTKIFKSIDVALAYVERHPTRFLFPIKASKKFPPLFKKNLELASNDPEQLRAWEEKWKGCNWGVALAKSKLMAADVDVNPAKGKVGASTYLDLELEYGEWPDTETTFTPSGGFHKIYEGWSTDEHPEHVFALGSYGIGKDIDSPNYLLIPGCKFDNGTKYTTNGLDAVRAPEWIYDLIKTAKIKGCITNAGEIVIELDQAQNVTLAIDFLLEDAEPSIAFDGGDIKLFKAAAYLKDIGISQELGARLLDEYFNPRCEPEWPFEMLERKMASAYTSGSLSKVGGRTAEADFADEPEEPPFEPMGIYDRDLGVNVRNPDGVNTPEKRAAKKAAAAEVAAEVGFEYGDRPQINVTAIAADLPKIARKVQSLFIKAVAKPDAKPSDQVFDRDGSLVHLSRNRLEQNTEEKFDKNYHVDNELMIKSAEPEWFADTLERTFEFYRVGKKKGASGQSESKPLPVGVPKPLVNRMFAIKQDFGYPKIKGTVETPTLRLLDGTILDKPGFDKKSGLYYDPGTMTFPEIADKPTMKQRLAALELLKNLLADFPFADEDGIKGLSLSVAIAMLLTAVCRRTLPTAPMFGIDATQANTGKTQLAQVAAIIMTGRETAVRVFPTDEYQRKNELAAAFEAGDAMILYDNIDGDKQSLEGDALCAALTSEMFQCRRFGGNSAEDQIKARTNSLMASTGNKLIAAGDMAKDRTLMCSLRTDKKLSERTFAHWPLSEYVIRRRPSIVAA